MRGSLQVCAYIPTQIYVQQICRICVDDAAMFSACCVALEHSYICVCPLWWVQAYMARSYVLASETMLYLSSGLPAWSSINYSTFSL